MNKCKKTKIVATLGPTSANIETLTGMIEAGVDVVRLNFSHGTHESHHSAIELVRSLKDRNELSPAVMLDTKGPEIRTHKFKQELVKIEKNSTVRISMSEVLGDEKIFSITHSGLFDDVKIGDLIRLDDGKLGLQIIEKDDKKLHLVCRALNTHQIKSGRNVNAPFARLSMPFISEKDYSDIIFGCEHNVDYIAASFTRRKDDILAIREIINEKKKRIQIIAKIENQEGVDNIKEILSVSDGIMVARGDLGVEVAAQEVPIIQKMIINECRKLGKPVIVATHMLDSMQKNPNPTRAEVSDVANAVFESTDCLMLSGESASGDYPIEAVTMQANIARRMEEILNYRSLAKEAYDTSLKIRNDAIALAVADSAILIDASLIVVFSETGGMARRMSKFRPCCPIVCLTCDESVALGLRANWGIIPMVIHHFPNDIEFNESIASETAKKLGIHLGSSIIITGGSGTGHTNYMKIVTVK